MPLPRFAEEAGGLDLAGRLGGGRRGDVEDGPVGEFGVLLGIGLAVGLAEGGAAVEDEVAPGVIGVGVDEEGEVAAGGPGLASGGEGLPVPLEGQLGELGGDEGIARGVAPEDEVVVLLVGGGDRGGGFGAGVAAEEGAPTGELGRRFR